MTVEYCALGKSKFDMTLLIAIHGATLLYCIVYFIDRFQIHDLKALKTYLQVKGKCPE